MATSSLRDPLNDPETAEEQLAYKLGNAWPIRSSYVATQAATRAGEYRQAELEARLAGDTAAADSFAQRQQWLSPLRNVNADVPQTLGGAWRSGRTGDYVEGVLGSAAASMERPVVYGALGAAAAGPVGAALGAYKGSYDEIRPSELDR